MADTTFVIDDNVSGIEFTCHAYDNGDGTYICEAGILAIILLGVVNSWQIQVS